MAFESYWYICKKSQHATNMHVVIMKAEVLRPARATRIEDIEGKLNEWKEKQRYLEDVGVRLMDFDQNKTLLVSILSTGEMDCVIKNPAMKSDREGAFELLEVALVEYRIPRHKINRKHHRSKSRRDTHHALSPIPLSGPGWCGDGEVGGENGHPIPCVEFCGNMAEIRS